MNPLTFVLFNKTRILCFIVLLLSTQFAFAQPANDQVNAPQALTSSTTTNYQTYYLRNNVTSVASTPTAGINTFCGDPNSPDVWFTFVANTTMPTIRLQGMGSRMDDAPRLQLFNVNSNVVATLNGNSNNCTQATNSTTLNLVPSTALTLGNTYKIRVFTGGNSVAAGTNAQWSFNIWVQDAVPTNDLCSGGITILSSTSCTNTRGSVYGATLTTPTNVNAPNCASTATYDVWYRFVAQTTNPTITLSNIGSEFNNAGIQLLNNTCGTANQFYCGTVSGGVATINANFLTPGTTYYIRIFSTNATLPTSGVDAAFDICVVDPVITTPAANDECINAVNLAVTSACASVNGNMAASTPSAIPLSGLCGTANAYDLWYKFKPTGVNANITLGGIGANFLNPRVEILRGGCGAFTPIACASAVSTVNLTLLNPDSTYYIRVYSPTAPSPNGNARFNICVTNPSLPAVRFGNSYVNISRKTTGGVVRPGDTLEIRMTINHAAATTLSALRFLDSIPSRTAMLTGATDRIRILTNEGLAYKSYTLGGGDDAATYAAAPAAGQYHVRMNVGFGASNPGIPTAQTASEFASATGTMLGGGSGNFPRGGGGVLFSTAYRVVVTGAVGDTIVLRQAKFLYQETFGVDITLTTTPFKIIISDPLTLCNNSIGVNNASESGGTFGSGTALNRGTDLTIPISGYSFVNDMSPFSAVGDGRYGIVKNMSPRQSTNRNAARQPYCGTLPFDDPASCNQRMYGHWYIDGDHSGTNNAIGNLPPDSLTNSGYMLMVNADYVASEVYSQTISNLCPDTYYEFSGWFRNICATCGVDSLGQQFTGTVTAPAAGYPGVYPNLSFSLDGLDYYNTGEIDTVGWVKKGFVFRTRPGQTTATFAIRNNAQGGGGNDWVLDDISVATCTPNLNLVPVGNTNQCLGNQVNMNCDVISFYNNYTYYQWQVSHNDGASFTDTLAMGNGSPVASGGNYVYNAPFPSFLADASQHRVQYRIRVATSPTNLYGGCSFFNSMNIRVMVNNCMYVLKTQLLSFNAALIDAHGSLNWKTTGEIPGTYYIVQKSKDGTNFFSIGTVQGTNLKSYTFNDPEVLEGHAYYRIIIKETEGQKNSQIELLKTSSDKFDFISVTNPFSDMLKFELHSEHQSLATVIISDGNGKTIRSFKQAMQKGSNEVKVNNLASLPGGTYVLQVITSDGMKSRKVVKLNN